jgi:hypothetical protein
MGALGCKFWERFSNLSADVARATGTATSPAGSSSPEAASSPTEPTGRGALAGTMADATALGGFCFASVKHLKSRGVGCVCSHWARAKKLAPCIGCHEVVEERKMEREREAALVVIWESPRHRTELNNAYDSQKQARKSPRSTALHGRLRRRRP